MRRRSLRGGMAVEGREGDPRCTPRFIGLTGLSLPMQLMCSGVARTKLTLPALSRRLSQPMAKANAVAGAVSDCEDVASYPLACLFIPALGVPLGVERLNGIEPYYSGIGASGHLRLKVLLARCKSVWYWVRPCRGTPTREVAAGRGDAGRERDDHAGAGDVVSMSSVGTHLRGQRRCLPPLCNEQNERHHE